VDHTRPSAAAPETQRVRLPAGRRQRIVELLRARGNVSIAALEQELEVSAMTIRRDLRTLEHEGLARRAYGGAVLATPAPAEGSFDHRMGEFAQAKARLADAAIELIDDGDVVFVDSSTAAFFAVRALVAKRRKVTLVTNSMPVQEAAGVAPGVELIALGGRYRPDLRCFLGPETVRAARSVVANKALMACLPVLPHGHLTAPDELEADVKRTMLDHTASAILLMSYIRPQPGLALVAPLSSFAHILTADLTTGELALIRKLAADVRVV
jgi:DeoR/GlpR family transcriptional regulator of sugar metabolism